MNTYTDISEQSRVWLYQADRLLTNDEVSFISKKITDFVTNWTAHNRPLKAFAEVRENLFILFYVDENESIISGCGIDKSVHLVEAFGSELHIDFFNRLNVAYESKNTIHIAPLNELKKLYAEKSVTDSTIIFNNIIQTKHELESSWKIPLVKSWISNRISDNNKIKAT